VLYPAAKNVILDRWGCGGARCGSAGL